MDFFSLITFQFPSALGFITCQTPHASPSKSTLRRTDWGMLLMMLVLPSVSRNSGLQQCCAVVEIQYTAARAQPQPSALLHRQPPTAFAPQRSRNAAFWLGQPFLRYVVAHVQILGYADRAAQSQSFSSMPLPSSQKTDSLRAVSFSTSTSRQCLFTAWDPAD